MAAGAGDQTGTLRARLIAATVEVVAEGSDPRARMREAGGGALVQLAPSLMVFIVRPYLGQAAASVELAGRSAAAEQLPTQACESPLPPPPPVPVSYRTSLVLRAIECAPRSSNREIAAAAGLGDKGQTSHLLRRLARRGLIEKVTPRSGSRRENAWLLTPCGRRVIELLGFGGAGAADADTREKQAQRSHQAGRGDVPRVPRELADYKRPSVRGPLVPASMTSVHPCGGRWSRSGALL